MNLKTFIRFTFLFSFILLFLAACDKEERKEYYGNGALKSITTYRDSVKDGQYISYYENGNKEEEGRYKDDKPNGLWKSWHENGQLRKIVDYKDGKMYASKSWYENGRLKEEKESSNGWRKEERSCWESAFIIESDRVYQELICEDFCDGDGYWNEYHENGQLKSEVYFKNGKKKWFCEILV